MFFKKIVSAANGPNTLKFDLFRIFIVGLIIFVSVLLIIVVLVQNSKGGGLSSQFGGNSSNQFMGVQKTNDLLEKATWTLAIFVVALTMLSNLFISSPDVDNIEGLSPNIDRANEQNIIQNTPIPEDIGDVPSELDSLL